MDQRDVVSFRFQTYARVDRDQIAVFESVTDLEDFVRILRAILFHSGGERFRPRGGYRPTEVASGGQFPGDAAGL